MDHPIAFATTTTTTTMVSDSDNVLAVVLDYNHQNDTVKMQAYTLVNLKSPKTVPDSLSLLLISMQPLATFLSQSSVAPNILLTPIYVNVPFPANILEATHPKPLPNSLLTTTDLIARCAINLQHRQDNLNRLHDTVLTTCCLATICFEEEHATTI